MKNGLTAMIRIVPLLVFALAIGVWVLSFIIDARRTIPANPAATAWWPEAEPHYVEIDGIKTRYISVGDGPDLLLLHTFSTELGHFRKYARQLSESYRVWALDLPGFGYSDLPEKPLDAQLYVDFIREFLDQMSISDVTIVGESIGGTIPIALSAQGDARVKRIVALDPIGAHPSPLARSSRIGAIFTFFMRTPVLSGFIQRIRNPRSTRAVYAGAMYDIANMPDAYFDDLMTINQRPEFPKAQKSFIDNVSSWGSLLGQFEKVTARVHLMWGEKGWAMPSEREAFLQSVNGATSEVVENAGHFISLDRPDAVLAHLRSN